MPFASSTTTRRETKPPLPITTGSFLYTIADACLLAGSSHLWFGDAKRPTGNGGRGRTAVSYRSPMGGSVP
jgi:hypothetical protein